MLKLAHNVGGRGSVMVNTSAQKARDLWLDSRSGHDQFCAPVSICLFNFLHRASLNF